MSTPEFLICLECESPVYSFDYNDGEVSDILCEVCGEDDPAMFATSEDYELMESGAGSGHR